VKYWFGPKQEKQLRRISKFFLKTNSDFSSNPRNVVATSLSRLIITKEPKASFARDTAHSRPHRTIDKNDFDIYENLEKSIRHVLSALASSEIKENSKTYLADARRLRLIKTSSIDAIITSPPYLNAIDYMRGHKFSLIWFGYNIGALRKLRSIAIGSETALKSGEHKEFSDVLHIMGLRELDSKTRSMLHRYYFDLKNQLSESRRVLKKGKHAFFVIGNSSLKGDYIENSEVLKHAARKVGFSVTQESTREIPDNRRYLPVNVARSNTLSGRMRTEHVIELS